MSIERQPTIQSTCYGNSALTLIQRSPAPNGWTWRTQELIGARQDEIEQRVRLPAAWTGWRMQGSVLVPKHRRFQIHPETAERFGEWAKSGSTGGA